MRFLDRVWVSFRHIRGRAVESLLVILATAVGVALVAAMAAFIRSYDRQTAYLLAHPAYREMLVEVVGNETQLTEPAVPYDPETASDIRLGYEEVDRVLESVPFVSYGYIADAHQFSTSLPWRGGGAGLAAFRGAGQAGAQGAAGGFAAPAGGDAPPAAGETASAAGETASAAGETASAAGETASAARGSASAARGSAPPAGDAPAGGALGGETAAGDAPPAGEFLGPGGEEGRRQFDLEEFFAADPDVVTDLPLESFPGRMVTSDYFAAYGLDAREGSLFTLEDVQSGNQVVVLGDALARALFPEGDAVGTRVRLNMQTYTVIGILQPTSLTDVETGAFYDGMAFAPNGEAQFTFGDRTVRFQRPTRTLRFAVTDSNDLAVATDQLQVYFDTTYGEGVVRITAPLDELTTEREKLSRILAVVLFLAAAGLFIASINLFNLMLMRVIRRTKGIGITKAIGASRREIFRQFLNESAFMSGAGAAIGLAVSPVVYSLLRKALIADVGEITLVSWPFFLVGAAAALAFSMLFGVYPARQAGRIDAAIAIRTE